MNRAEKLKMLQGALQGTPGLLQQLHRERRKKSMPYLDAHGIIDAGQCPAELLNLMVMYGEIDEPPYHKTFSEWVNHCQEVGQIKNYGPNVAYGFIDADESQYDRVKVNFIKVTCRSSHYLYCKDVTIGDLRRYYNQSELCFRCSIFALCFEFDLTKYERYVQRIEPV